MDDPILPGQEEMVYIFFPVHIKITGIQDRGSPDPVAQKYRWNRYFQLVKNSIEQINKEMPKGMQLQMPDNTGQFNKVEYKEYRRRLP